MQGSAHHVLPRQGLPNQVLHVQGLLYQGLPSQGYQMLPRQRSISQVAPRQRLLRQVLPLKVLPGQVLLRQTEIRHKPAHVKQEAKKACILCQQKSYFFFQARSWGAASIRSCS